MLVAWTKAVMTRLGLVIDVSNEARDLDENARISERFEVLFLGVRVRTSPLQSERLLVI